MPPSVDFRTWSVRIHADTGCERNAGSEKRLSYTPMGAPVNVAARLEGLPPDYNVPIVIGEAMQKMLKGPFETGKPDEVGLKGVVDQVPTCKATRRMEPGG